MKKLLLALALVFSALAPANGATAAAPASNPSGLPDTVASGFAIYSKNGYASAIDAWSKGSSLEIDAAARNAITKSLSDAENTAGTFVGAELIKSVPLSQSSMLVYVFAKYQKGGLYLAFACSKTPAKWRIMRPQRLRDQGQVPCMPCASVATLLAKNVPPVRLP